MGRVSSEWVEQRNGGNGMAAEQRIKGFRLPHHNLSLLRCLLALVTQLPLP